MVTISITADTPEEACEVVAKLTVIKHRIVPMSKLIEDAIDHSFCSDCERSESSCTDSHS